ncbi:hypothetical protein [Paenibacillus shenyangensis]|uniref:hypothetical protein n=1 Tax=Paenibacillus sp. A9 TaxID=1284352 RepID=UPI00037BF961|nr:hypothetical protein [Paenibacillus sp. A9]
MENILLIDEAESATFKTTVVGQKKQITIAVSGTASSATVNFKGRSGGVTASLAGIRPDYTTGSSAGMNEVWKFDLSGLTHFTVEVASVSGGNVTVQGRW